MNRRGRADSFAREPRARGLVAAVVVEDAACDDADVFGEVEGRGDDEQREEEEENRVCGSASVRVFSAAPLRRRAQQIELQ